jgi:Tol biopolymer transport system component
MSGTGLRNGAGARPPRRGLLRDPYGLLPAGTPVAAILSIVGLLVIAVATLSLVNGRLPIAAGGGGGPNASGGNGGVAKTPTPSNVVNVPDDPLADVPGSIVYAKDGNIWVQSGRKATELTFGGADSMPSFAADGASVYFVRTRSMRGYWTVNGVGTIYTMDVPSLMQVPVTGGTPQQVFDGLVDPAGKRLWMGWIREPVVSPDGRTIAMATDLPDPTRSDVVIKLLDLKTKKITDPGLSQVPPLGHQDPAWRPDGALLLYVRSDRDGAKGTPRIYSYNPATKKSAPLSAPGYLHPSWSPDGRYVAATKTSAFGTDVVILAAATGAEVLALTSDGGSWAPAWSPRGDAIAYLHVDGQVVDLRMVALEGSGPTWTPKPPLDLTTSAGLDGISRPGWFIPADQLPASPAPSVAPSAAAPGGTSSSAP